MASSFFVEGVVAPAHVASLQRFEVDAFKVPGMLDLMRREAQRTEDTFCSAGLLYPLDTLGALLARSECAGSLLHGEDHWRGVAAAGVRIIEQGCPADPAVVFAFSVLHDAERRTEGYDPDHGARAAALATSMAEDHVLLLDSDQLDVLCRALVDHDRGFTSNDPTIGACWDADRLTLRRLGIVPDPRLLSTQAARELTAAPWIIPNPDDCDWRWIAFRYQLADQLYGQRLSLPQ